MGGYYTQNYWPSVVTPYGYSTCYGCRGKRSAEPGYLGLGYGYGYGIGGVSRGVGLHPAGSVYESRSAQCLGKRSAEPGYLGYGVAPYGHAIGGVSTGVGLHATGAVYESRSAQGLGKRSADAEPGYYTQNYWPSVVTPYGYSTCYGCRGKRSAEPGYLGLGYAMDMASEVSAEVLVSTLLGLSMSPDLPKVLVSAVLSQAILDMVLPLMAMLLEVSALE